MIGISTEKQELLLARANEERWSVQLLEARVRTLRQGRNRGGRRAQSVLGKHLRTVEQCLEGWCRALDGIDSGGVEELDRSMLLLAKMKSSVERLADEVEARRNLLRSEND